MRADRESGRISAVLLGLLLALCAFSAHASWMLGGAASSGGAGGFYSDPYSTYSSVIADTSFMGTNGANTTVSWNGSTLTAPTYSTAQAAINAAVAAGPGSTGERIALLCSEVWNVTNSGLTFPSTAAFSNSLRLIVQGDPACSPTTMPQINGGGTSTGANGAQGFTLGYNYNTSTATNNQYITIRKVEIYNFVNTNGAQGVFLSSQSGGSFLGFTLEYSYVHHFQASGAAGESGPVYQANPGDNTPFTIRYNKLGDVYTVGGTGTNENHSCIGIYGGELVAYNNELYLCYNGFRQKGSPTAVPQNIQFYNNLVHDVDNGYSDTNGGESAGPNGVSLTDNLFVWKHLDDTNYPPSTAIAFSDFGSNSGTVAPANITWSQNTVSSEWGTMFANVATTGVTHEGNLYFGSNPVQTSENSLGGTLTTVDYDAYFQQSNFVLNQYAANKVTITTFSSGATNNKWTTAHTDYPSYADLSANPDSHGFYIPSLTAPYNTIAGNVPGYASYNYALAPGSPLKGAGPGGVDIGYNASNNGPGW